MEYFFTTPIEATWKDPGDGRAMVLKLPESPRGEPDQAFFYKLESGTVVGYFNRCSHVHVPLDFDDQKFLDLSGMIICRVHGARYALETGDALLGPAPCGLFRITIEQDGDRLHLKGWARGKA